jgi:hypothetical protein
MKKIYAVWLCLLGLNGCAAAPVLQAANDRPFNFPADSFSFNNDLVWDYHFDKATGAIRTVTRDPKPDYTHHCFVVARSARQFFQFAKFDASRPPLKDEAYRRLIDDIVTRDPSETENLSRVMIPGYSDLRSFSVGKEHLLKQELGSAAMSYLQRGNWRMVFPFWRGHQEETAKNLLAEVRVHRPPVVHLATFPRETINHAVLVYGATENAKEIRFKVYDPNNKDQPTTLTYDRAAKTFYFPPSAYFIGGRVDAYEVYSSLLY